MTLPLDNFQEPRPPSGPEQDQLRQAQLAVANHARDEEECRELLLMLGIAASELRHA